MASCRSRGQSGPRTDSRSLLSKEFTQKKSLRSEGPKPSNPERSKPGIFSEKKLEVGAFRNGLLTITKTLESSELGRFSEKENSKEIQKLQDTNSQKHNTIFFGNNTLGSNLSPNSNISFSTLKDSKKSRILEKKTVSIRSGYTHISKLSRNTKNSKYSDNTTNSKATGNSERNSAKFPLNSRFLNRLKRKTKKMSSSIYSRNSKRSKKSDNTQINTSQRLPTPEPSPKGEDFQLNLNGKKNQATFLQNNKFLEKKDAPKRRKSQIKTKNSESDKIFKEERRRLLNQKKKYYRRNREGLLEDEKLQMMIQDRRKRMSAKTNKKNR